MTENVKLFTKYLNILEIEKITPSLQLLSRIVKSHLTRIPFENISKLLYKKKGMLDIPNLQIYLNGIEKHNFGGTCYSINYYLYLLLKYLGFNVKLCGADMRNPDVHLISMVNVDEREFIVDCGYAAPFLMPLPRDLDTDFVINFGNEKYVVKPKDKAGKIRVEQYSDNKLQHWYSANPQLRTIEEFEKVIKDSYADDATFMKAIRAVRFTENGSISLRNLALTETSGADVKTTELNRENIPGIFFEKFGMPEDLVAEAIFDLGNLNDIYS